MGHIRDVGVGWGGPAVGFWFLWGGLQFFLGHSHGTYNTSLEFSAQSQSTPFLSKCFAAEWVKRGVSGTCPKVRGTRARVQAVGVSQANGAALHTSRIVPA